MRKLLFIVFMLWSTIAAAYEFQMGRIGSIKANGVPVEISVHLNNSQYHISIVGKDDSVGALVTHDKKRYNVSLLEHDLDILATLKTSDHVHTDGLEILVKHTTYLNVITQHVPDDSSVAMLIKRMITIFHLPEYRVRTGETLSDIVVERFHKKITIEQILEVNPGLDPDHIGAGRILKIPKHEPLDQ